MTPDERTDRVERLTKAAATEKPAAPTGLPLNKDAQVALILEKMIDHAAVMRASLIELRRTVAAHQTIVASLQTLPAACMDVMRQEFVRNHEQHLQTRERVAEVGQRSARSLAVGEDVLGYSKLVFWVLLAAAIGVTISVVLRQ